MPDMNYPLQNLHLLFVWLLVLAAPARVSAATAADAPDIVLILADDLGCGDLGCYGQTQVPTPHLDRLAAQGVRFSAAYACPACAPTRRCLLTGLHLGSFPLAQRSNQVCADDFTDRPTLAQHLLRAGYATAMTGKWGMTVRGAGKPAELGFQNFLGYLGHIDSWNMYPDRLFSIDGKPVPLANEIARGAKPWDGGTYGTLCREFAPDRCHAWALEQLRQRDPGKPLWLYVPTTLVHGNPASPEHSLQLPTEVLAPYASKDWPDGVRCYAAALAHLDAQVGEILADIAARGAEHRTVIIFTSDNGASTASEGSVLRSAYRC
jgi:arylsulfatase A-like enzyme